jgi:hypothetical protein
MTNIAHNICGADRQNILNGASAQEFDALARDFKERVNENICVNQDP